MTHKYKPPAFPATIPHPHADKTGSDSDILANLPPPPPGAGWRWAISRRTGRPYKQARPKTEEQKRLARLSVEMSALREHGMTDEEFRLLRKVTPFTPHERAVNSRNYFREWLRGELKAIDDETERVWFVQELIQYLQHLLERQPS
jgi:hypothetical protein